MGNRCFHSRKIVILQRFLNKTANDLSAISGAMTRKEIWLVFYTNYHELNTNFSRIEINEQFVINY